MHRVERGFGEGEASSRQEERVRESQAAQFSRSRWRSFCATACFGEEKKKVFKGKDTPLQSYAFLSSKFLKDGLSHVLRGVERLAFN